MRKCFEQGKHVCARKQLLNSVYEQRSYKLTIFACFCVSVPEVSCLRAQVFVHGVQGAHAAIFL